MTNVGTNTWDIEVTPQRNGSRLMTSEGMSEQVPMPHINLSILGYDPESLRSSHVRAQDTGIQEDATIPQLDGPVSIPIRGRGRLAENIRFTQEYP